MDEQIENLLNEISKKRDRCEYFREQCSLYKTEFDKVLAARDKMDGDRWEVLHQETKLAKKEADSNLNCERRMLNILENKLRLKDFSEVSTTPTVQKRKIAED
jgi:hypothetical protein